MIVAEVKHGTTRFRQRAKTPFTSKFYHSEKLGISRFNSTTHNATTEMSRSQIWNRVVNRRVWDNGQNA